MAEERANDWLAVILNGTFVEVLPTHRARMEHEGIRLAPIAESGNRAAQLHALREDVEIIFGPGPGLDEDLFSHAPHLKVVSVAASGYESVDVAAATRAGIVVTNAPTPMGSEAVADLAFGLMLCVARDIPQRHARLIATRAADRTMGRAVWGQTLGIVGLGSIGKAVVRRARGFDMRVLAYNRSWDKEDERFAHDYRIERADLDSVLRMSDFVSLHLRGVVDTQRIIGAREIGLMKPGAFLINTARAGLVDEAALYDALVHRAIAGAGLDVAIDNGSDSPLVGLPHVVVTPHLGNRCIDSVHDVVATAIDNALAILRGQRPRYVINPEAFRAQR